MSDLEAMIEKGARALASVASGGVVEPDAPDLAWQDWTTESCAVLIAAGVPDLLAGVERLRANLGSARRVRDAANAALDRVRALRDRWGTGLMAYSGKITAADLTAALSEPTEGES